MARGRIISNEITRDKTISELSCDTSRLAFTWLITFADCEGRVHGDPALLRSLLFPRRSDITIESMRDFVWEWFLAGLIIWYQDENDMWIYFPNFDRHQSGLRKDREAPSNIPSPPAINEDELRSYSGFSPEPIPVKLKEIIRKEVKGKYSAPQIDQIIMQVSGMPTLPSGELERKEQIYKLIDEFGESETIKALESAYSKWITTKTKNGHHYKRTNFGWVDWAQELLAGGDLPTGERESNHGYTAA